MNRRIFLHLDLHQHFFELLSDSAPIRHLEVFPDESSSRDRQALRLPRSTLPTFRPFKLHNWFKDLLHKRHGQRELRVIPNCHLMERTGVHKHVVHDNGAQGHTQIEVGTAKAGEHRPRQQANFLGPCTCGRDYTFHILDSSQSHRMLESYLLEVPMLGKLASYRYRRHKAWRVLHPSCLT